jgi:hypothetical protein
LDDMRGLPVSGTVFISHSNTDQELVEYVARLVQSQGLTAYLAEHDIQAGSHVADKVLRNIRASDAVLVLLTKRSVDSHYVQQEIGAARMANKLVVPLVDPKVEQEARGLLEGAEYISFDTANPAIGTPDLVGQLRRIAEKAQLQDVARNLIIAAIVIGALCAAYHTVKQQSIGSQVDTLAVVPTTT